MSSPTDRIREALDFYQAGAPGVDYPPSWKRIMDAARSFVEGEPIEWCEVHADQVMPHIGTNACRWAYRVDGTKTCSIVTRWLSERPATHLLPGDADE